MDTKWTLSACDCITAPVSTAGKKRIRLDVHLECFFQHENPIQIPYCAAVNGVPIQILRWGYFGKENYRLSKNIWFLSQLFAFIFVHFQNVLQLPNIYTAKIDQTHLIVYYLVTIKLCGVTEEKCAIGLDNNTDLSLPDSSRDDVRIWGCALNFKKTIIKNLARNQLGSLFWLYLFCNNFNVWNHSTNPRLRIGQS